MVSSMAPLPILAPAKYTVRYAAPRLANLPHATALISRFLDTSVLLTPLEAAAQGSPALLDRVLQRVLHDAVEDKTVAALFRAHWLARALALVIRKNDLARVQQIHGAHAAPLHVRSLQLALQYGSLEMVQWIAVNRGDRRCCEPGLDRLCRACLTEALPSSFNEGDAIAVGGWLLDRGVDASRVHAFTRHAHVLRWLDEHHDLASLNVPDRLASLIENGPRESSDAVRYLIDSGVCLSKLDAVKSLIKGSCQPQLEPIIDVVVASPLCDAFRDKFVWAPIRPGGPKVMQWNTGFMMETLVRGGISMAPHVGFYSAQFCHVDTIQWLWRVRRLAPVDVPVRKPHCENDLLTFYQWMADENIDGWCSDDTICAARHGYLSAIQWLHAHRPYQLTTRTMDEAASAGHLHVVQWLQENRRDGCTIHALVSAAQNGHFEVVKWMAANRADGRTNESMVGAAQSGHLEILAWLHANRFDSCSKCVLRAVLSNFNSTTDSIDTIRWLTHVSKGARTCRGHCTTRQPPGMSVSALALRRGDLTFARYIFEYHWAFFDIDRIDFVVKAGHLPVIQWLYTATPKRVNWRQALETARASGVEHIAEWLETVVGIE